jgi:hypothetical protein
MKFNGTQWVTVGNGSVSQAEAAYTSLAFKPSGEPFVAYQDAYNSSKATVRKFDGSNWVDAGNAGFSESLVYYPSLAFSPSGQPYLAYVDEGNSAKATVMKLDSTNWVNVGNAGFSDGEVRFTSLAFSPSGQPFVAFSDWGNSKKATVMKYDSVYVGINEPWESALSLHPNPVKTKLIIDLKDIKNNLKVIEVFELRGKKIFETQTKKDEIILNVENYPEGIYLVKIKTNNSSNISKFCKN